MPLRSTNVGLSFSAGLRIRSYSLGPASNRRGVTLVEVLVTVSIAALILHLAIPAIQASREAARRQSCQNNLKQIGLAFLHYETAHSELPTAGWGWGWMGDPNRGTGTSQPGSWTYQLLPFMEGQNVYAIGIQSQGDDLFNSLALSAATPIPSLYCPARRSPMGTHNVGSPAPDVQEGMFWYNSQRPELLARMDYVANIGNTWAYWHAGPSPSDAKIGKGFFQLWDVFHSRQLSPDDLNGVVMQRRPVEMRQITDGTTNTYFGGEKPIFIDAYDTGWAINDDQSCWVGDDLDSVASTEFALQIDRYSYDAGRPWPSFGSAHAAGVQMLYCDGSVSTVHRDIDRIVHEACGDREDGAKAP